MIGATVQTQTPRSMAAGPLSSGTVEARQTAEQSTLIPKAAASSTAAPRNCAACMTAGTMETTVRVSIIEQWFTALRPTPAPRALLTKRSNRAVLAEQLIRAHGTFCYQRRLYSSLMRVQTHFFQF